MKKIVRITSTAGGLGLLLSGVGASCCIASDGLYTKCGSEAKHPNLVFVFTDQQSYDMLGCYGNRQIVTPNLDGFARQGIRFTCCFSNSPVSTPFRGMLMTGRHPLYNGAFANDKPLIPGHGKKFAEVLADAGYVTAYVGKWHLLGGDRNRPVPEDMRYGFGPTFYTNNCHVNFNAGACFYYNDAGEKVFFDDWEVFGQTRQALGFLESQRGSDHPFALFVSWHPPHDWGKFKGEDGRMHYRYDAPGELMARYDRGSIRMRPGTESTPDRQRMYHGYMASVTGIDMAFGQLMEKLQEIGADENTLVVFTSDHGDMLEFSEAAKPKEVPHDYSCRVPLMMRMPEQLSAGDTSSLLIGALDIMPTVLGLLELRVPDECHGQDLSEEILSGDEDAVEYVPLWLYHGEGYRGVITRDFTFAMQPSTKRANMFNVLFDRNKDPHQLRNLFDDPEYVDVKKRLTGLTLEIMERYKDRFWSFDDFTEAMPGSRWNANRTTQPIDIMLRYEAERQNP